MGVDADGGAQRRHQRRRERELGIDDARESRQHGLAHRHKHLGTTGPIDGPVEVGGDDAAVGGDSDTQFGLGERFEGGSATESGSVGRCFAQCRLLRGRCRCRCCGATTLATVSAVGGVIGASARRVTRRALRRATILAGFALDGLGAGETATGSLGDLEVGEQVRGG